MQTFTHILGKLYHRSKLSKYKVYNKKFLVAVIYKESYDEDFYKTSLSFIFISIDQLFFKLTQR